MHNLHEALRAACVDVGIVYRDVPADGRFHATDIKGDGRGKGDGRIKLFPDRAGGVVCNWKEGEPRAFFVDDTCSLTVEERQERHRKRQEVLVQAKQDQIRRRGEAALKARELLEAAIRAAPDHPYLIRKDVAPIGSLFELRVDELVRIIGYYPKMNGELLAGRILLVPVKIDDKLSTLELIDEHGRKSALVGGSKGGGFWETQAIPDCGSCILIGEGVATVLSAHEATGYPAIAALSAGQLTAAARTMRDRYPSTSLVILADIVKENGKPDARAIEAARSVGGLLAVPEFGTHPPEGATDFNDMAVHFGKESVARVIAHALASAQSEYGKRCGRTEIDDGSEQVVPEDAVTAVTGVQPSNRADLSVTAAADVDVTAVTCPVPGLDDRPRFVVIPNSVHEDGRKYHPGVWYFGVKQGRRADEPPMPFDQWICTPLNIEAVTSDGQDGNFGRMLRFKNTNGRWREWAMPMELLRGSGEELRGELLAMGVQIDPNGHRLLGQYLQSDTPPRKVRCALQVGWCGDSYVLPDEVIGASASTVIFQSGERGYDEHSCAGTLEGWKSDIAARAVGNPLLALALSASFAGPLLALCNAEGGGVHFVGDSSTGKTTAIEAACATWGGPGFRRSWRATANGMEGAAALFNDCLLALDEISECDPREVGAIVYALGNGRGKQRASRSGTARSVTRWRCFVLSSGERTIGTTMAEGGKEAKAGQAVRLLDVPAMRRFGAWDSLHGFSTGTAMSDAIKQAAAKHHGHAGRAFLHKLTRDSRDFPAQLERIKALPEFAADGGEGQHKRAAARFALLALAGELATEYGLTGWAAGEAIEACAECFRAWRATRGGGNDERRQIIERVTDFIERHGDSRFSNADDPTTAEPIRNNRAGWWREEQAGRVYLFNSAGLREALKGFDFRRALDVLQEAGALPPADASGERAKPVRIAGRPTRLYAVLAQKLGGSNGA